MLLRVQVCEARDVPKMDFIGRADPYCLLSLSSSRNIVRTRTVKNTYKPVWNETFEFPVTNPQMDALNIMMKDEDFGKKDDSISRISIAVRSLPPNQALDKWYNMTPVPGVKKGGQLRLVLTLLYVLPQPPQNMPQQMFRQPQGTAFLSPQAQIPQAQRNFFSSFQPSPYQQPTLQPQQPSMYCAMPQYFQQSMYTMQGAFGQGYPVPYEGAVSYQQPTAYQQNMSYQQTFYQPGQQQMTGYQQSIDDSPYANL